MPTAKIVPEPVRRPIPVTLRLGAHGESATGNFFEEVGGQETFDRLVRAFYERVRQDPVLWRMYPQDDYEGAIHRLSTFLRQLAIQIRLTRMIGVTRNLNLGDVWIRAQHKPYLIEQAQILVKEKQIAAVPDWDKLLDSSVLAQAQKA